MGGFVDPFAPLPAWPQEMVFTGSSWTGGATPLADPSVDEGELHLRNGARLQGQLLRQGGGLRFAAGGSSSSAAAGRALVAGTLGSIVAAPAPPPCPMSLTDSAPAICSSNESNGSEQSGLPQFLAGDQHPQALPEPAAAWPPAFATVSSMAAGEATSQGFGFGSVHDDGDLLHDATCTPNGNKYQQLGAVPSAPQLHIDHDVEFNTGELLSFAPGIDGLQIDQKDFSGLQHLDLCSSLVSGPLAPFNPKQLTEASGGSNGGMVAQFANRPEVTNGGGVAAASGAPKPRMRARRGQATDPHSIAERLRREKISDRMKNLQELVPNSNKTDKASMLDEIIEYVRFLQLQVKVLSMSRLGATEAVVPLLTESSQADSNGLLLSPRSDRQSVAAAAAGLGHSELQDSSALEQEVVQLMENNMTTAMQYLQSKGLCLMPVALASAISSQKGTSSAAVLPAGGGGDKDDVRRVLDALKPLLSSPKEMKSRA